MTQQGICLTDSQKRLLMDIAWEGLKSSWVSLLDRQPWSCDFVVGIEESELKDAKILRDLRLISLEVRDMNVRVTKKGYELVEKDVLKNIAPIEVK